MEGLGSICWAEQQLHRHRQHRHSGLSQAEMNVILRLMQVIYDTQGREAIYV